MAFKGRKHVGAKFAAPDFFQFSPSSVDASWKSTRKSDGTHGAIQLYFGPFKTVDEHPFWASPTFIANVVTGHARRGKPRTRRTFSTMKKHFVSINSLMKIERKLWLLLALLAEAEDGQIMTEEEEKIRKHQRKIASAIA